MKHPFFYLSLLAALATWALPPVYADNSAKMTKEEKKEAKKAAKEAKKAEREAKKSGKKSESFDKEATDSAMGSTSPDEKKDKKAMAKAFKNPELKIIGKPNKSAKYYLYCCVLSVMEDQSGAFLDSIVEKYKEMKRAKVDVIIITEDKDTTNTQKLLKDHKASFPIIQQAKELSDTLPGYSGKTNVGHVTVVDQFGERIADGDEKILEDWKGYTIEHEAGSDDKTGKDSKEAK